MAAVGAILVAEASSAVKNTISDAISRNFGTSATDKGNARVAALKAQAMAGDEAAFIGLCYEAFEPARGLPGDLRPMKDGTRSPKATRAKALAALQEIAAARGGVPTSATQWAAAIGAPVLTPRSNAVSEAWGGVTQIIREGVAQGTREVAAEQAGVVVRQAVPWVAIGGVLVVGVVAYAVLGRRR